MSKIYKQKKKFWLNPYFLVSLMAIGFLIYCYSQIQTHYLLSKEAFLGNLYRGKIIPFIQDNDKAIRYLTIAAKNNNEAYCDLGEVFEAVGNGKGMHRAYLVSAMQGSQRCEVHYLNHPYENERNAYEFLKVMADDRNFASAKFMVGKRLIEGNGVEKNVQLGIAYLKNAVAVKHPGASLYLAGLYINGQYLPRNMEKANELIGIYNKQRGIK